MIRLTPYEIKEAFPEGEDILRKLLKPISKELKGVEKVVREVYAEETYSYLQKFFFMTEVGLTGYTELLAQYKKLKRQLAMYDENSNLLDLETAKTIPIKELYEFENVKETSKRTTCSCPFHDEKNPSFVIYTESNTYYCFSCNSGGDAVAFIMQLNGMDFISALKYLLGIRG